MRAIKIIKDNKEMLLYLGILFFAVLLTYKIPHDSYSISQYIIKPINTDGGGVLFLSGLIPLVIGLIGTMGFINLKRFANKSKILLFLLVVVIIIPLMKWSLDFTRTNYYWIKQDSLNAVDIEEPDISLLSTNDKLTITMNFKIKDYSKSNNEFKFRVIFPETLSEFTGKEIYESKTSYKTHGYRNVINVEESMVVDLKTDISQLYSSQWFYEDVIYEIYNDDEIVRIVDHGI